MSLRRPRRYFGDSKRPHRAKEIVWFSGQVNCVSRRGCNLSVNFPLPLGCSPSLFLSLCRWAVGRWRHRRIIRARNSSRSAGLRADNYGVSLIVDIVSQSPTIGKWRPRWRPRQPQGRHGKGERWRPQHFSLLLREVIKASSSAPFVLVKVYSGCCWLCGRLGTSRTPARPGTESPAIVAWRALLLLVVECGQICVHRIYGLSLSLSLLRSSFPLWVVVAAV